MSVFSPNVWKHGPEKLWIRTDFRLCSISIFRLTNKAFQNSIKIFSDILVVSKGSRTMCDFEIVRLSQRTSLCWFWKFWKILNNIAVNPWNTVFLCIQTNQFISLANWFWYFSDGNIGLNPLSANYTKCSNALKQFVRWLQPTNYLSVFDHFIWLTLRSLSSLLLTWDCRQISLPMLCEFKQINPLTTSVPIIKKPV